MNAAGIECRDRVCKSVRVRDCNHCDLDAKFDFTTDTSSTSFSDLSTIDSPGTTITNWLWRFGDGDSSTLQNPTHVYAASGTYRVCLAIAGINTAGIKCKDRTCKPVRVGRAEGEADYGMFKLETYPNPATDFVTISFITTKEEQVNVTLTDILGKELSVIQNGTLPSGDHNLSWNADDVSTGWYVVTIKTNSGIDRRRVLIQR